MCCPARRRSRPIPTDSDPLPEQWYEDLQTGECFEVVNVEFDNDLIEIQYGDGAIAEIGFEEWRGMTLEMIKAPSDIIEAADHAADEFIDYGDNASDRDTGMWPNAGGESPPPHQERQNSPPGRLRLPPGSHTRDARPCATACPQRQSGNRRDHRGDTRPGKGHPLPRASCERRLSQGRAHRCCVLANNHTLDRTSG